MDAFFGLGPLKDYWRIEDGPKQNGPGGLGLILTTDCTGTGWVNIGEDIQTVTCMYPQYE